MGAAKSGLGGARVVVIGVAGLLAVLILAVFALVHLEELSASNTGNVGSRAAAPNPQSSPVSQDSPVSQSSPIAQGPSTKAIAALETPASGPKATAAKAALSARVEASRLTTTPL